MNHITLSPRTGVGVVFHRNPRQQRICSYSYWAILLYCALLPLLNLLKSMPLIGSYYDLAWVALTSFLTVVALNAKCSRPNVVARRVFITVAIWVFYLIVQWLIAVVEQRHGGTGGLAATYQLRAYLQMVPFFTLSYACGFTKREWQNILTCLAISTPFAIANPEIPERIGSPASADIDLVKSKIVNTNAINTAMIICPYDVQNSFLL